MHFTTFLVSMWDATVQLKSGVLYSQYNNKKDYIHGNKISLYRRDKLKKAIIENKKLLT